MPDIFRRYAHSHAHTHIPEKPDRLKMPFAFEYITSPLCATQYMWNRAQNIFTSPYIYLHQIRNTHFIKHYYYCCCCCCECSSSVGVCVRSIALPFIVGNTLFSHSLSLFFSIFFSSSMRTMQGFSLQTDFFFSFCLIGGVRTSYDLYVAIYFRLNSFLLIMFSWW